MNASRSSGGIFYDSSWIRDLPPPMELQENRNGILRNPLNLSSFTLRVGSPQPSRANDVSILQIGLKPLLNTMKIFGLYTETTESSRNGTKSKVRRFMSRAYQTIVLLLTWFCFLRYTNLIVDKEGIEGSQIALVICLLWYFLCAAQTTVCLFFFSYHNGSRFTKFVQHHRENFYARQDINVAAYRRVTIPLIMVFSWLMILLNIGAVTFSIFTTQYADQTVNITRIVLYAFSNLPQYGEALYVFIHVYETAAWVLPLAFYVAIISLLLNQCTELKRKASEQSSVAMLVSFMKHDYYALCESVELADELFKWFMAPFFCVNVPLACFNLYNIAFVKNSTFVYITASFWLAYSLISIAVVCGYASALHNKFNSFKKVMEGLSTPCSGASHDTNTKMIMLMFKLYGEPPCLTVGGVLDITKPTILTVFGLIATYFIIMWEFHL